MKQILKFDSLEISPYNYDLWTMTLFSRRCLEYEIVLPSFISKISIHIPLDLKDRL